MLCCHRLKILNYFLTGGLLARPICIGIRQLCSWSNSQKIFPASEGCWESMLETAGPGICLTVPFSGAYSVPTLQGSRKGGLGRGERLQELSPSSPWDVIAGSRSLVGIQGPGGGGRMGSPAEGREAALHLSSEARPCPHDPDLRPPGCHQRKRMGSVQFPFPGELPLDDRRK